MAALRLQKLTAQLDQLASANKATQLLIDRLANLKFVPGSSGNVADGEDNDGNNSSEARVELAAEIHESLKNQEEGFELLRQEVEEALGIANSSKNGGKDKARLSIFTARLGEDLKNSRASFRRAQLTAKRTAEATKAQERALLFSNIQQSSTDNPRSSTPTTAARRNQTSSRKTEDEILLGASSDITAALRRTHALIQSELSRSQFAQETLERGTEALSQLNESYTSIDDLLSASKGLLSTLVTSQKSDTWYLESTFYILVGTLGWLIFRRLLYGPLYLVVLFPLRICIRLLFGVFTTLGFFGRKAAEGRGSIVESSGAVTVQASLSSGSPPSVVIAAKRASDIADMPGEEVPVADGGLRKRNDPSADGSLSQQVGQMAEASMEEDKEAVVRGDGTVLPDRAEDQPRNPKKKTFEVEAEEEQPRNPKKKVFKVETEEPEADQVRDEL